MWRTDQAGGMTRGKEAGDEDVSGSRWRGHRPDLQHLRRDGPPAPHLEALPGAGGSLMPAVLYSKTEPSALQYYCGHARKAWNRLRAQTSEVRG